MNKKYLLFIALTAVIGIILAFGCGGGAGTTTEEETENGTGSELNDGWEVTPLTCEGTYTGGAITSDSASVVIADGKLSTCANVSEDSPPTLDAASAPPDGFELFGSDENVTDNGVGYTLTLNGSGGFFTTSSADVTITVPFDASQVDNPSSTKVFLRIFNPLDNSIADITGTVDPAGQITVNTFGLPAQCTIAVIYNPNMTVMDSAAAPEGGLANEYLEASPNIAKLAKAVTKAAATTWPASDWCTVYDPTNQDIINEAGSVWDSIRGTTGTVPTNEEIAIVVYFRVTMWAKVYAQRTYEAGGFHEPFLYISTSDADPCGKDRYYLHLESVSSKYQHDDPLEAIAPDNNHYGRIYIEAAKLGQDKSNTVTGAGGIAAHEMFHGVQWGYGIYTSDTTKGFKEGPSSTYGMTINHDDDAIHVRTYGAGEIQLLSNYLMMGRKGDSYMPAYANQDFFAYVGREYNNDNLAYLADLYTQISSDIQTAMAALPTAAAQQAYYELVPRKDLMASMDTTFTALFGTDLKTIYLDFLRQRALEHNANSQFGRSGETTSGFAEDLFEINTANAAQSSVQTVNVDTTNCTLATDSGMFANVAPFAARAIKIVPSAVSADTTADVTVTFTPTNGTFAERWGGYYMHGNTIQALSDTNKIEAIGITVTDEAYIVVANVFYDALQSVTFDVTCEQAAAGGGGHTSSNTFGVTSWDITGETQMTPVYANLLGYNAGSIDAILYSVHVLEAATQEDHPYLTIHINLNNVTGAGTYDLGFITDYPDAYVVYTNPETGTYYGTSSTGGGTITLTAFGTTAGEHLTGSFETAEMLDAGLQPAGGMNATFDFELGTAEDL